MKKLTFKYLWSRWNCPNCGEKLTFDIERRLVVALCFGIWVFAMPFLVRFFDITPMIEIFSVLILLIGGLYIFSFDKLKKVK
jgi:hypothetical protein